MHDKMLCCIRALFLRRSVRKGQALRKKVSIPYHQWLLCAERLPRTSCWMLFSSITDTRGQNSDRISAGFLNIYSLVSNDMLTAGVPLLTMRPRPRRRRQWKHQNSFRPLRGAAQSSITNTMARCRTVDVAFLPADLAETRTFERTCGLYPVDPLDLLKVRRNQ